MTEGKIRKEWFVFYTKSRQEKKVNELLLKNGFESFLPIQKVMRQWSDRKKRIEVPLFNSYIFVRIEEYRLVEVLKIPGVSWIITHNGKPAFLRQQEYEVICRYLQTGLFIETVTNPQNFEIGEKVKVIDGPLKGFSGVLTKKNSDTIFSVFIDTMKYTLSIQLDNSLLQRIYPT